MAEEFHGDLRITEQRTQVIHSLHLLSLLLVLKISTVYQKQSVYLTKIGVRLAYILPSPAPLVGLYPYILPSPDCTCGIILSMFAVLLVLQNNVREISYSLNFPLIWGLKKN